MCPCKDCEHRSTICHSICSKYKEWKENLDHMNDKIKEAKREERLGWRNRWSGLIKW